MTRIVEELAAAFESVPRPSPNSPAFVPGEENDAFLQALSAHAWEAVPLALIEQYPWFLSRLLSDWHHYYLPAYLSRALESTGDAASTVLDACIYDLCADDGVVWNEKFIRFTDSQMRAIAAWLRYVIDAKPPLVIDLVVARQCFDSRWREWEP